MKSLRQGPVHVSFATHEENEAATAAYWKSKTPKQRLEALALLRSQKHESSDETRMIQFGVPPYRIDILVKIRGVDFEEAYPRIEMLPLGGTNVPFIGLEDLKQNKKATGRHQDLGDLEALERLND